MHTAIVTGAGGFIGSHLVGYLKKKGYGVVGIDIKYPEFSSSLADRFILADLRNPVLARNYLADADELYMLAADMGGVGYIDSVHAKIMHDNVLINANSLDAAKENGIAKVFYSSSACVYPQRKQQRTGNRGLREQDALPADPDTMYGWEKLFTEQMCRSYALDYSMHIRVARFHNIYGPEGAYDGGREKSPAALCRKIARASSGDTIEIWGDGQQTRSYCFITDCCEGIFRLMHSSYEQPLNIGTSELVSISGLADLIAGIAGKEIRKAFDTSRPQGVRGRNSDNTLARQVLGWEPTTSLRAGIAVTYAWICDQVCGTNRVTSSNTEPVFSPVSLPLS